MTLFSDLIGPELSVPVANGGVGVYSGIGDRVLKIDYFRKVVDGVRTLEH